MEDEEGLPGGQSEIVACLDALQSRNLIKSTRLPGSPHAFGLELTHEGRKELAVLRRKTRRMEKLKNVVRKIGLANAKWFLDLLMELARNNANIT